MIATYPQRAKVHNARRDAAVSICVQSDDWNGEYVQVDGRAAVLDLPEALEPLVDYFRGISGEHSDWDEYRAAMVRQGKCIIRIEIDRWGPIATGGFPPDLADDLTPLRVQTPVPGGLADRRLDVGELTSRPRR